MKIDEIAQIIRTRVSSRANNEAAIHEAIKTLVKARELPKASHEWAFEDGDRVDFFIRASGIAIEVKVAGNVGAVARQLFRYEAQPTVKGLILVTNRRYEVDGLFKKPFAQVCLFYA